MDKFEIGDKAIVIKSFAGNEGKIVEVVGFYQEMDFMYARDWPEADLTVLSLGAPFQFGTFSFPIAPAISTNLKKLPKVKDEEELTQKQVFKKTEKV
jgi:hypothetical protein